MSTKTDRGAVSRAHHSRPTRSYQTRGSSFDIDWGAQAPTITSYFRPKVRLVFGCAGRRRNEIRVTCQAHGTPERSREHFKARPFLPQSVLLPFRYSLPRIPNSFFLAFEFRCCFVFCQLFSRLRSKQSSQPVKTSRPPRSSPAILTPTWSPLLVSPLTGTNRSTDRR